MTIGKRIASICLLALLAVLSALPAEAGNYRKILISGTATSSGDITVETFSKPDFPRLVTLSTAGADTTTCHILNGDDAFATAIKLAAALNSKLPAGYSAMVDQGYRNVVWVTWNGVGNFSFTLISDTMAGQSVAEWLPGSVPTLSEWGLIILGLLIVTSGAWYMSRRRAVVGV